MVAVEARAVSPANRTLLEPPQLATLVKAVPETTPEPGLGGSDMSEHLAFPAVDRGRDDKSAEPAWAKHSERVVAVMEQCSRHFVNAGEHSEWLAADSVFGLPAATCG